MLKNMGEVKRNQSLDILRFICMVCVIMNHVCDQYIIHPQGNMHIIFACEAVSRIAVPCFLMFTGYFLIDSTKIENKREFYRHSFYKLLLPTLLFSIVFTIWYLITEGVPEFIRTSSTPILTIKALTREWLTGWSGHHTWYMFMLVILYMLLPYMAPIIRSFERFGKWKYAAWSIIVLILIEGNHCLNASLFSFTLPRTITFFAFVITGYACKVIVNGKKNNLLAILFISCGLFITIGKGLLLADYVESAGIYTNYLLHSYWSPLSLPAYGLIFAGFALLNVNYSVSVAARYSFYVYLLHKCVLEVLYFIQRHYFVEISEKPEIIVPLLTIATLVVSLLICRPYVSIEKKCIEYIKQRIALLTR